MLESLIVAMASGNPDCPKGYTDVSWEPSLSENFRMCTGAKFSCPNLCIQKIKREYPGVLRQHGEDPVITTIVAGHNQGVGRWGFSQDPATTLLHAAN